MIAGRHETIPIHGDPKIAGLVILILLLILLFAMLGGKDK